MKIVLQIIAYVLFFALVGYFAASPPFHPLADDAAIVSLSFSHSGKRIEACRRLTQEELMALPPNMRKPDECPRERHPIRVGLLLDGQELYRTTLLPTGVWSDGKATVYQRFTIPAGDYQITVQLNDSGTDRDFDYEGHAQRQIQPGQNLVVYFDSTRQQFEFE